MVLHHRKIPAWASGLFRALANLSKPGTTLATFTAAAVVKQGLQAAGFAWQNSAVLARKRDMLTAVFLPLAAISPLNSSAPPPTTRMPINIIMAYHAGKAGKR